MDESTDFRDFLTGTEASAGESAAIGSPLGAVVSSPPEAAPAAEVRVQIFSLKLIGVHVRGEQLRGRPVRQAAWAPPQSL